MLHERDGYWRWTFSFRGKRHFLDFGLVTREEAERQAAEAGALLARVKSGELELPEGCGIGTLLFSGPYTPEEYRKIEELNRIPPRWFDAL